jgi:hypothetical protein
MHCPKCGQQQVSEETRFCSRCGFLLTGIAEVVANSGVVPTKKTGLLGSSGSKKRRGVMQGAFMFLLTFLVVPLLALISIALDLEPFLPAIGVFLLGVGGVLRIIYALMFEAGATDLNTFQQAAFPVNQENRGALPPSQSIPASAYTSPTAGSWRDTNDLQYQPGSVTDTTTKLLQREERDDQ